MFVNDVTCTVKPFETDILDVRTVQIAFGTYTEKDDSTVGRAIVTHVVKAKRCKLVFYTTFVFCQNFLSYGLRQKLFFDKFYVQIIDGSS
ncbi:hypothetical protein SDC9_160629 [bioreactor metagenome]|uniref:Uncharacterized protein n=1 Tax=bioreactor metagenome TaxID=1076179 RepID=A0A645FFZ0_9ZZZZ